MTSRIHLGWLLLGMAALSAVVLGSLAAGGDGGSLTRNTIRLSLAWYFVAVCLMSRLESADWTAATLAGQRARWCWTWALACFLIHLAMAFHFYHHWSHAHAVERTREISGWGEGIFVSYLFTLLWLGDVAWWWLAPRLYAVRSRWIGRVLHAFMLFIVFNGTIVYESGVVRWAGCAMFAVFAALGLAVLRRGHAARPLAG